MMFFRVNFIYCVRSQFFFDRCCFFSYFIRSRNLKMEDGVSFSKLFPFLKRVKKKRPWVKLDRLPYYYDFNPYYLETRNLFYSLRFFLQDNFLFDKKNFRTKILRPNVFKIGREKKKIRFRISFNYYYYYYRRKNKQFGGRSFFFLRSYRKRLIFCFFKYLFLSNKFVSNVFYLPSVDKSYFLCSFNFINLSFLFIKYLYVCVKFIRLFFFDFDWILFLNKLFFFSMTRSFALFSFLCKLRIFFSRFVCFFYLCFKLKKMLLFFRYYKRFKYRMLKFFFFIRNNVFYNISFFFSKFIYLFFFFRKRSGFFNIRSFLSSLYLCKEKLFVKRSYNFLFNKLFWLRRKIRSLSLRRTSFFFIRSTTYNTYYTFLFNGRMLYKKSAGMFEANRKCRLQYDVIKKMSDHFKTHLELFLIKFSIKKLHVILSGFRKFQRYIINGLRIIRNIKKRKYLGAFFAYRRLVRKWRRLIFYYKLLRYKISNKKRRVVRELLNELKQLRFRKKKLLLEIFRHKKFLFVQDYMFIVSHQPFNGCRGRRLITKRK